AADRRQRLFVCSRRDGRGLVRRPLLPRAVDGRAVHPEGRGGGNPGRCRQPGGRARGRDHPRGDPVDLLPVPARGLPRSLRAHVSRGDPAVPPQRTVREPEMSAVWLLLPLYLVPVVSHNEVLLTILIFTYILGILAIAFNIVFGYAGQLTMFHGAAFGIG